MISTNEEKIIEIKNLSKKFKEVQAVDDLSLTVYRGDVFGFLGPNGAGKSTTIRMLVSLIHPSHGEINIFGKNLQHHRNNILSRIGAIVEKPDFYKTLSAYKNLEIFGRISGTDTSKKRIMEVLETVGLAQRAKSKVKTYSHGMKQRLGIAQALLHNPELIILDEPTTGLDPQGMKDIRDLIIHLSQDLHKTIFLSSHILYEVQLVANRMIIINKGKKRVEGIVSELLESAFVEIEFKVSNVEATKQILAPVVNTDIISNQDSGLVWFKTNEKNIPELNKLLVQNGIEIYSIIPKNSLEDFFLSITEKDSNVHIN